MNLDTEYITFKLYGDNSNKDMHIFKGDTFLYKGRYFTKLDQDWLCTNLTMHLNTKLPNLKDEFIKKRGIYIGHSIID